MASGASRAKRLGVGRRELGRRSPLRLVAVVVWLAVVTCAMGAVSHAQESARHDLEDRFNLRTVEGATFAGLYVEEIFRQQYDQAVKLLSATVPSEDQFEFVTSSLGYRSAVLLDDRGRALNVAPADPAMVGRDLTTSHEYLRQAVAGHDAVSAVVPSAFTGRPIVAFAVPFDTLTGLRVFSGGFDASNTPLVALLTNDVVSKPGEGYLIDASSAVVAASTGSVAPGQTLREMNPALADALRKLPAGLVRAGSKTSSYFTSAAVAGTSWRIVTTMPTANLYEPVNGSRLVTTWLLVAALALGGAALVVLIVRMSDAARARRTTLGLLQANATQLAAARDEAVDGAKRLADAQRLAHLGSWEWDVPTDTVTWSDELYRIFGCEPDELDASYGGILARLHPDDRPMVEDAVRRCMETHEPLRCTARLLTGEGELRWIEAHGEVEAAADGTVRKMAGTTLDITDSARAKEELEGAELRFANGFEHSPIGIALGSIDGRYLKVNPALCRMLGRDEATLLAMRFQDLTHPEDLGAGTAQLEAMRSGESESWQTEKRYVRPDGVVLWAQLNTSVVLDGAGAPSYVFSQVQDITQRKVLADAVVLDREFLATVLHNLSDGVVACDAEGVLTLFNRAAQEFHGLPVTATAPEDWAAHYGLFRSDGITSMEVDEIPLLRALRGERVRGSEMVIVPQGARRRVVRVSAEAIRDGAGKIVGAVAAMHDVTDRKQAEDDLASLNACLEHRVLERTAEAERANGAKSEFLSRMSHELRTPLNAVLGFAQLLSMDDLGPEQAESVKHIMFGGRHLLALIDEVLDLTSIEAGHLTMSIGPVALAAVLDEALDLLRPQAAAAAVSLPAHAPVGTDVHVMADHQRLRQVVMNLLSNAVKYNSAAGTVSLTCERSDGGRLRVAVTDTGPGIAAGEADRLFTPFERLAATATAAEGTGLGLAVSKRLADAMGADIGLTSVLGQGSTFWVDLCLADCEVTAPEAPAPAGCGLRPGTGPATVLYIEDNPSNLRLVQALLGGLTHVRLLTATSGQAGLELANQRLPDLVLLDLGLPDIPGAEVLTMLRANATTANIPVVVVSADATDSQVRRLLAAGATAYLTKPLDAGILFAAVDEALTPTGRPDGMEDDHGAANPSGRGPQAEPAGDPGHPRKARLPGGVRHRRS